MNLKMALVVCALLFAGCNAGSMVYDQYDGKTGQLHRTVYSKYYDAGDWIIPHHLGMSVVVDHEKTEIPVAHEIQQSIGALGPDDVEAKGKVTVYIWNRDVAAHKVRVIRVSSPGSTLEPKDKTFTGVEGQRTGGEVGYLTISNYGTQIPLKVVYEIDGKSSEMELTLLRRTEEELKKYFGSDGTPPYPWYHDNDDRK